MSNIVSLVGGQPVTTTLVIADGTGVDHASVIKLVRTYRTDLEEFGGVGFEIQPFETAGGTQQREIACLNEQQATLLMTYMRNSEVVREFKKRLVKAFWDMARQLTQPAVPQSLPEALRLAADLAEQKSKAEAALAIAAPKAEALDRLETGSDGSFCLTDAAKALQVPPRKFVARLQQMGWIYRRPMGSGWLAYQDRLTMGVMEHKVTTGDKSDGTEWASTQVRVTAKGMARLALIIAKEPVSA